MEQNDSTGAEFNCFCKLRPLGGGSIIHLDCNKIYTIGRDRLKCDIIVGDRLSVSRRHCQIVLDSFDRKLRLIDGFYRCRSSDFCEVQHRIKSGPRSLSLVRASLNGVYVNGCRVRRGSVTQLSIGDEILLGCGKCGSVKYRSGFVVERIVFFEDVGRFVAAYQMLDLSSIPQKKDSFVAGNSETSIASAEMLLKHCRSILRADDPMAFLGSSRDLGHLCKIERTDICHQKPFRVWDREKDHTVEVSCPRNIDLNAASKHSDSLAEEIIPSGSSEQLEKVARTDCYSDGRTLLTNLLEYPDLNQSRMPNEVTLPELLYPVETLTRVFVATFTSDVAWFLTYCRIPSHLPVTIACHSSERGWSSTEDSRTATPYSSYPNLVLVYPRFPDVIAFGKDRSRKGVACHHPKLFVLQRDDYLRVIVTSANLVSKQWNNVINTVWLQDFPCRDSPDYSSLFSENNSSEPDFAAHLAGFVASLIIDVPSQAHWIQELTKYDFEQAAAHLVSSVPGIHVRSLPHMEPAYHLAAKQITHSPQKGRNFIGCIPASVVGLSHHFHSKSDKNGVQLKVLASFLGKIPAKTCGPLEVLLKRNDNIPADANAVSILVADLDEHFEGDYMQLGFLPRDVAKWVSPLSDSGFFSFSAFIYPKEALAAALGEHKMQVQLLLYVSQGPNFHEISNLIQSKHIAPLCSLTASLQRCLGLWRLQEILCQYKWPGTLERDFVYSSSSIGISVNPQFLASFSAAVGKRSLENSDSDESDPEWGYWNINYELRNPSVKILFPTIERVKSSGNGIFHTRRMLSMSEKTWQRLGMANMFHDAVPYPPHRDGYPMHVKVARRSFQSNIHGQAFGWIYSGSHNFSPAAWGHMIYHSAKDNGNGDTTASSGSRLRICNYELGILLVFPPPNHMVNSKLRRVNLDEIVLPFVIPAPKYQEDDRPATIQAMREALAEATVLRRECSLEASAAAEEVDEDVPEEEEMTEASDYLAEEGEEEKIYAEMLWSQVDSLGS